MKITLDAKTRQALLDAGFPRQTIYNWTTGRFRPSRLALQILRDLTGKDYGNSKKKVGKAAHG